MAMGVDHICVDCTFRHCVHFCLHVQQVLVAIYVDGAIRTAGAKVMPFTTQHASELKCWGDATLGGRHILPATSVSLCISTCPAARSGTHLSTSPHLGWCFILISRSPYCPAAFIQVALVPHLRCFPVPFVRVPGIHGLDCPAVSAVQLSACRDRCFTSPPQGPCHVNLGSMRAS